MEPVYLFNLIDRQKSWLSTRQSLVAQNIANVNTPGYKAMDALPFARVMERSALEMAGASPMHMRPAPGETMAAATKPEAKRKRDARVDASICIGCGVCALTCPTKACHLAKRKQRVIHPETTFERLMLQCLERGTLHNQIFADPQSINEKFMRAFVGGFLKLPPVKKALMSDKLRSKFLAAMKEGVKKQGKVWLLEI